MADPYAIFDELVEALEAVRRQQRLVVRLFSVVLVAMLAGFVALFYFTQDLPKETAVPDSRVRAVENDLADVKASVRQAGAELKSELAAITAKLERAEQDMARLNARLGATDMRAAEPPAAHAEPARAAPAQNFPSAGSPPPGIPSTNVASAPNPNQGEPVRNDAARPADDSATAQASTAEGDLVPAPLPRRRPSAQAIAARTAAHPFNTAAAVAGAAELKPGAQIAPGQFALRPIPDELESKMPRLKGKMFFRHDGQIYVVDPKDNKVVELLKQ
jgi:hypothetical protein